jgi:hypothetical protein
VEGGAAKKEKKEKGRRVREERNHTRAKERRSRNERITILMKMGLWSNQR